MLLDPCGFVMYGQLSLLQFRRDVVSQNQSLLQFDWCVMHLSVCPSFFCVRSTRRPTLHRSRQGVKLDRIFAASLQHRWLHMLLLMCFAISRVPSFIASVALGRTLLLATLEFKDIDV